MPLKNDTLIKFKRGNVFLETGTHHGDGIGMALLAGFDRIYSIEIDQLFINETSLRFKSDIESEKVTIIRGDTKIIMGSIIGQIREPMTFWLDAHWDFGAVRGQVMCPLYEELTFIKNHPIKTHTILIDDMRLMGTEHHWGKIMDRNRIIELVKEINKDYLIQYTDGDLGIYGGICKDDIMVALL